MTTKKAAPVKAVAKPVKKVEAPKPVKAVAKKAPAKKVPAKKAAPVATISPDFLAAQRDDRIVAAARVLVAAFTDPETANRNWLEELHELVKVVQS